MNDQTLFTKYHKTSAKLLIKMLVAEDARNAQEQILNCHTFAVVDMAPAIFIWEFMTFVCVDMEVTLELTA